MEEPRLVVGDLNARLIVQVVEDDDMMVDGMDLRGRRISNLCREHSLIALNGGAPGSCGYTYLRGTTRSVLDLVICSRELTAEGGNGDCSMLLEQWHEDSDHRPISIMLEVGRPPLMDKVLREELPFESPPDWSGLDFSMLDELEETTRSAIKRKPVPNSHPMAPPPKRTAREEETDPTLARSISSIRREMKQIARHPRFTNCASLMERYSTCKKTLARMRKEERSQRRMKLLAKLETCKGGKYFWDTVKQALGKGRTKEDWLISPRAVAQEMERAFAGGQSGPAQLTHAELPPPCPILDDFFDADEVRSAIQGMRASADGCDEISTWELKEMDDALPIVELFEEIARAGRAPQSWHQAHIVPLPKKGFTLPTRRTFNLPGSEPITDARHLLDQTNEYVVRALNSSYPASIQPTNRTHHLHGYNTRSWFLSTGTWSSHFVAST
ncbi:hypothetical protein DFH27DRAFT_635215 [Peziza echinospora]|nr:hypothetical protein DFH27DRAFT_635215 [Peziza echinospora]